MCEGVSEGVCAREYQRVYVKGSIRGCVCKGASEDVCVREHQRMCVREYQRMCEKVCYPALTPAS